MTLDEAAQRAIEGSAPNSPEVPGATSEAGA